MQVKKQQLEMDMEQQTGSKLGKEYMKAVYCHLAYLICIQSSVQFSSVAQSCPPLCDPMNRSTPGLPVHHHLPEFTQTCVHRVCDDIQPFHPLSSPSPPAPNPSQNQSLSNESTLRMKWPKYWSFSFSIIPSKEIPGLISFRMDWLDLLAVHGILLARILEWVAMPSSRGTAPPRDQTCIS